MPLYYSTAYLVGDPANGDFYGGDLMPKLLILQQEGGRSSIQVFYLDEKVKPLSNIRTVVPASPEDPYMLLDSVVAFYPEFFKECSSLSKMKMQLKDISFLDQELDMPGGWKELRDEALPYFKKLRINSATFEENWRLDR